MTVPSSNPTSAAHASHVPLTLYRFRVKSQASQQPQQQPQQELMLAQSVYTIKCKPRVIPLDINVQWLVEQGWQADLDRLRFSPEQLFLRRFDIEKDVCILAQLQESMTLTLYGNDESMVELYFHQLFLNGAMEIRADEMGVLSRGWVEHPHDVLYYSGSVHAAFGTWGKVLVDRQLNQLYKSYGQ